MASDAAEGAEEVIQQHRESDEPSSPGSDSFSGSPPGTSKTRRTRVARTMSFLDAYTAAGHHRPGSSSRRDAIGEEKLACDTSSQGGGGHGSLDLSHTHADEAHEQGFIMGLLTRTSAAISVLGALVLIIGCVVAFLNVTLLALKALPMTAPAAMAVGDPSRSVTLNLVRSQLGHIIVFTLEILVAADVIETLAVPVHVQSFATLGKIAIIVAVRTCLSFFLEKELEAVDEELRHEKLHETCNVTESDRHHPRSFPLLSGAGEGVLSEAVHWSSAPSLMLLVTCGLVVAALVLLVAKHLDRSMPIAELVVVAFLLMWCHRDGSARLLMFALAAAGIAAFIVHRRRIQETVLYVTATVLQVAVPQTSWHPHQLVFWLAGCSAVAWGMAEASVALQIQQSSERLWLAILLVSITFYAVNSFPLFHTTDGTMSPPASPLRKKAE